MKVLFIQHASGFGGSVMSLLYTMQTIRKVEPKIEIVVGLAKESQAIREFYESHGFPVVYRGRVDTVEHTQAFHFSVFNPLHILLFCRSLIKIFPSYYATKALVDFVRPDIVHLNSVVLLPSALALKFGKQRFVWHVREFSTRGLIGLRRSIISFCLRKLPEKVIFICEADRRSWKCEDVGTVVYNFVDKSEFEFRRSAPALDRPVKVLFLGGVSRIKGGLVLLKALSRLTETYSPNDVKVLIAGGIYTRPAGLIYRALSVFGFLLSLQPYSQKLEAYVKKKRLEPYLIRKGFSPQVYEYFSQCDILVFPSVRPHFPRPILEAHLMGLIPVATRNISNEEVIDDGVSGFLVNNEEELASVLNRIIGKQLDLETEGMIQTAYRRALNKFDNIKNTKRILEIYNQVTWAKHSVGTH